MNEMQSKKLFDKYNPKSDVARCPSGRAKMRKPLDLYAKAAVNLYGIISKDEFVEIFNSQNEEQTTVEEVYALLLPQVLKHGCYGFYKKYFVHYDVLRDFDFVDYLEKMQADKPRYIPEREEFLKYKWEIYDDNPLWIKVCGFLWEVFGFNANTSQGFAEIKSYVSYNMGIHKLGSIMEKYNFVFSCKKQLQKFMDLLMVAKNNTRIWENKGHTPNESYSAPKKEKIEQSPIVHNVKVGRNDSCPCGSGKKYKKCCSLIQANGSAQLSISERKLFYEAWYKLLEFVNRQYSIVDMYIDPTYPSFHDELELYKIREKLWEDPEIIGVFLRGVSSLSDEERVLLQSWQTRFIKDEFILMRHTPEYSVLMSMQSGKPCKLYGVKGMTSAIAEAVHQQLPTMFKTVLLPFKDKIVYDSFMSLHNVAFGEGVKNMFTEEYVKAKDKFGIITTL